jgi:hypothetical protein
MQHTRKMKNPYKLETEPRCKNLKGTACSCNLEIDGRIILS